MSCDMEYIFLADVMGITDVKGHFIHVAARQSPYPGTSIARFPVFDKYVPWEVRFIYLKIMIPQILCCKEYNQPRLPVWRSAANSV